MNKNKSADETLAIENHNLRQTVAYLKARNEELQTAFWRFQRRTHFVYADNERLSKEWSKLISRNHSQGQDAQYALRCKKEDIRRLTKELNAANAKLDKERAKSALKLASGVESSQLPE